jgi:hypothetical protein
MANEFIARKGLIALSDSKVTGSLGVTGSLVLATPGGIELGHVSDTTITRASAGDVNIEGNIIYRAGGTDVPVTDGGTGVSTLTDGGILLGSGTGAITATAVLADGEILIGDGTTDPVALDVGGNGAITILGTIATGTWEATDVEVAHGGTGVSTLTDGGVLLGSGANAITAMAVLADSEMIVGDGSGDPVAESGATLRTSIGVGTGDSPQFTDLTLTDDLILDSDASVIHFGDNQEVTLTHVHDTGLLLNTTSQLQFYDASQYINAPTAASLAISGGGTTATFTSTGVGIGVAAPAEALAVVGDISASGDLHVGGGIELGAATDTTVARASAGDINVEGNIVYRAGGTDVPVADGGTGASSLTDGYVLLGSGTGAITALNVTADGAMLVGDGSGDPVAESGATLRTSIGVGTGDSPQLTAVNVGHASDTTVARASAGDISVEGNVVYRAGGTNIPVSDGGTGASALTDKAVLISQDSGTDAVGSVALTTNGQLIIGGGSGPAAGLITADDGLVVTTGDGTIELDLDLKANGGLVIESDKLALDLAASSITNTLAVGDGGTGATTLTDGGVLLGSGTGAVTAMAVLADSEMIVGDGTTDPVAESGATLRTSIGVGASDNVTFDTGSFTGDVTVSGNLIVTGTRTELQTSQLKVEDALITVASGSANSTAADGAGIEIDMGGQTNPAMTWDHSNQELDFNYPISSSQISGSYFGDGSGLSNIVSTLNTVGDSGTGAIALKTQTLTIAGGEGITTTAGSQTVTVAAEDASDSNKGVASFNSTNFSVSSGAVTSTNISLNGTNVTLGGTRNITLAQITNAGATTTDAVTFSTGATIASTNISASSVAVVTGDSETTSVIAQIATASYSSAQFDYSVVEGGGLGIRAGTVIAAWKTFTGTAGIQFTDFSTPDIGDTSDATFTMDGSGANARLKFTSSTGSWAVSSSVRAL